MKISDKFWEMEEVLYNIINYINSKDKNVILSTKQSILSNVLPSAHSLRIMY